METKTKNYGMKFPKIPQKKKRKKHRPSILRQQTGTCYLCALLRGDYGTKQTQEHHIFGGANRRLSEEYGLKVNLCLDHHLTGKEAVHTNAEIANLLHEHGQREFAKNYPEEDFRKIFKKNYL